MYSIYIHKKPKRFMACIRNRARIRASCREFTRFWKCALIWDEPAIQSAKERQKTAWSHQNRPARIKSYRAWPPATTTPCAAFSLSLSLSLSLARSLSLSLSCSSLLIRSRGETCVRSGEIYVSMRERTLIYVHTKRWRCICPRVKLSHGHNACVGFTHRTFRH